MRIVFMGSPNEVIPPLNSLIEAHKLGEHELVAVISQPARPKGRGQTLIDPPVAAYAKSQGIAVFQPERASSSEFISSLQNLNADIFVTAAYGQILSDDFLRIAKRATINIHPSLLPKYRGAIPVAAALLDGLETTGVSVLFTVKKLDAGNIIVQESFPIPADATTGTLTKDLFEKSSPLLLKAIELCKNPMFIGEPQDEALVTHCKKINKEDGQISWNDTAQNIFHRYQAFSPWPGLYCFMESQRLNLFDISIADSATAGTPGKIHLDKLNRALVAQTAQGTIQIKSIQRAGGKQIGAIDFWNSLKNRDGAIFA